MDQIRLGGKVYRYRKSSLAKIVRAEPTLSNIIGGALGLKTEETPFSRCIGSAHDAFFEWLDIADARQLMLCNKFLREDVRDYTWGFDVENTPHDSPLITNLKKWRACFPNAKSAILDKRTVFQAADFHLLRGLRYLDLNENVSITDAAFVYLEGIHTINMGGCRQITDAAFENLRGINTLDMSGCTQITDAAFEHLRGINTLNMSDCIQITEAAFIHLRGINTLIMNACYTITDAVFVHLRGINTLNIEGNTHITDAAFKYLSGIGTQS